MGRYKDDPPVVRVYTVCGESRYLIVRNVPVLGCGDALMRLFNGEVEECMQKTVRSSQNVFTRAIIKFAKRKLDESVFLGNRLQISYASEFESLSDTKKCSRD